MKALERYRGPAQAEQAITHVEAEAHGDAADRLDLQKLISAFRRRLGVFFLVLLNCVAIAIAITAYQTPTYTAVSRVMINIREQQVTPQQDPSALSALPSTSPVVDTEVEVIGSRQLAGQVASELRLDRNPAFNPALSPPKQGLLDRLLGRPVAPVSRIEASPTDQAIVDRLLSGLPFGASAPPTRSTSPTPPTIPSRPR